MMKTALFLAAFLFSSPVFAQEPVHALAMHGEPKYAADFKHLDYVNPDAPKGGTFRQHVVGTFDSLNPFIVKGMPAAGTGLIYQTLLEQSSDEPFTEYGSLAETVEMPEDRSWVIFNLRPAAKWHDGVALTADDVVWTFNTLITEGTPFYKAYYANVKTVEALTPHKVKFTFDMAGNRELPLIMGQISILPKHYWTTEGRKFGETTLTPPLGSGAYKISAVKPGDSIEYARVADWWAKDLPINIGRHNFDRLVFTYYRDANVALEAFLGGRYDFRQENTAKLWATAYESPAVRSGNNRAQLAEANAILNKAGYVMGADGVRVHEKTGQKLEFEFIDNNPAFERWIAPFIQNLKKIGIKASYRTVDASQYQNRMNKFDFDMTVMVIPQSSSPGNEQREYWSSDRADMEGSRNYIGIKDPVIDALVQQIVSADTREELIAYSSAMDRILQWGYYMVPNWYMPAWRLAYWDKFGKPETIPAYNLDIADVWWAKSE